MTTCILQIKRCA